MSLFEKNKKRTTTAMLMRKTLLIIKSFGEVTPFLSDKECQESDISTKSIKESAEIFSEVLHLSFNASVNEGSFPPVFRLADATPNF